MMLKKHILGNIMLSLLTTQFPVNKCFQLWKAPNFVSYINKHWVLGIAVGDGNAASKQNSQILSLHEANILVGVG